MTHDELMDAYQAAWSGRDPGAFAPLCTDDVHYEDPLTPPLTGAAELGAHAQRLWSAFPDARVSWIYASSEAGAAIAVHDGLAGFPEAWLTGEPREGRPRLSIDGDELIIASPHRGVGVAAALHTGDRIQLRHGRVLITGRLASDEINVGGSKVSASQVREVLLGHPGVRWANVRGRRAPLVGTVVSADVVLSDDATTETDLARWCAARLADYAVPRRFRMLDSIPLKESLKSDV